MSVKTALRVIEIIETYAREKRALPLSELARLLDVPVSSCLALIRTLMDQHSLSEQELPELGSAAQVREFLRGNDSRQLTQAQIAALSRRFHLSPALFF